jgi:hypothetical protein
MRIVFHALLAALAFSHGAAALASAPAIVACHNCSDHKAARTAEAQVPYSAPAGVYDVYVADTPQNLLRRYRVIAERENRIKTNHAMKRTPTSEYMTYFRNARNEWQYVSTGLKPNIVLPADFPIRNAESVIGSEFNQTVVSEQLNRHLPTRIGSLVGAALMMLKTVFNSPILAEVEFPDGSRALFTLQRIDSLTSGHMFVYRYKPGSAIDSDGNRIPDSASAFDNYQGLFTLGENFDRFRRRADMYGVDWPEGFRSEQLPAHTVCVRDDQGNAFCWHN